MNDDVAHEIKKLGAMEKDLTANKLAAKGIELSLRDKLIKQVQKLDQEAPIKIVRQESVPASVEIVEKPDEGKEDPQSDEDGLEFYDPEEERRLEIKRLAEEKQRERLAQAKNMPATKETTVM